MQKSTQPCACHGVSAYKYLLFEKFKVLPLLKPQKAFLIFPLPFLNSILFYFQRKKKMFLLNLAKNLILMGEWKRGRMLRKKKENRKKKKRKRKTRGGRKERRQSASTFAYCPEIKPDHTKPRGSKHHLTFNLQLILWVYHSASSFVCSLKCVIKSKLRSKILSLPDTRVSVVHLPVLDHF